MEIISNGSTATNASIDHMKMYSKVETAAIVVSMAVTFLVALFGNTVVISVISRVHSLQTATNLLLLNLSAADLVIATLNLPFKTVDLYIMHYWPFGNSMCKLSAFSQIMVFFVSIFSLVAVAYERFTTVCKPKFLRQFVLTANRVKYVVGAIWLAGILVASPMLKFFQTAPWRCPDGHGICEYCYSSGWTMDALKVYSVIVYFLFFIFPLSVMSFTYFKIGRTVWQSARNTSFLRSSRESERATKSRITKISLAMILSFVIAWGPGLSKRMYDFLSGSAEHPSTEISRVLYTLFHWFQYSNCALNPVLYSFMSNRFRRGFCLLFRRASHRRDLKLWNLFAKQNTPRESQLISNKFSDDPLRTYNRTGSSNNTQRNSTMANGLLNYESSV